MSFDQRTSVVAAGGRRVINSFIDASTDRPPIDDVVRAVLHSHYIAMSRMNVLTLSSDCATNCTSAASDRRDKGGRPLPGSAGDTTRSADKVVINTLKFLHRAHVERDYLLSMMD